MAENITLDRETFKVLAQDTRIDILKRLGAHKETLTDIAEAMRMSPSTIKEHLDKLVHAKLIETKDTGTKWKYYVLTRKGKNILDPHETKVWILLGTMMLLLFGATFGLLGKMDDFSKAQVTPTALAEVPQALEMRKEMDSVAGSVGRDDAELISRKKAPQIDAEAAIDKPYLEITAVILLSLVGGACIGYLTRRRSI